MTTNPSSHHTARTAGRAPSQPPAHAGHVDEQWTDDRVRALGVITDLPTAAEVFGLGRTLAYQLARDGQFPVPVLRVGNRYRVAVGAILAALHIPATAPVASPSATTAGPAAPPATPGATVPADDLPAAVQSSVDHHGEMRSNGPQRMRAAPTEGAP